MALVGNLPGTLVSPTPAATTTARRTSFARRTVASHSASGQSYVTLVTYRDLGRDLAQVGALNSSVFTGLSICSNAYCQIADIRFDRTRGRLTSKCWRFTSCRCNGVTNVPLKIAADVANAAAEAAAAEAHVLKRRRPKNIFELTARRRAMGDATAALRRQVSRAN
jgi:hypothetical protein